MSSERMKKIYYNCEVVNQTASAIDAKYDVGLLKAIIENPMKYNINVNRFRLPLNGVPLSRNNIPFQQWQACLGYLDPATSQWNYETAYVPQYNPLIDSIYIYSAYVNSNGNGVVEKLKMVNNTPTSIGMTFSLGTATNGVLLCNSPQYVYFSLIGASAIYVLDVDDITKIIYAFPVIGSLICMACDVATNNVYVVSQNVGIFSIVGNVYSSSGPAWTSTLIYTANAQPLLGPVCCCFQNSKLFVGDAMKKVLYYWSNVGEPTQISNYQNLKPLQMTALSRNLIVAFEGDNSYDQLYGLTLSGQYLDINNNESQCVVFPAPGVTAYSKFIVFGDSIYCIGSDSNLYTQSIPFSPTSLWTRVIGAIIQFSEIFLSYSGDVMYGYSSPTKELYVWNLNSIQFQWTLLATEVRPSTTSQFVSFDVLNERRIIAVGSDNNVYRSVIPLATRYFVVSQNSTTCELIGTSGSNTIVANSTLAIPNTSLNCLAYVNGYFIAINTTGGANVYNTTFTLQTTLALSECSGNIKLIRAFAARTQSFLVIDGGNNIRLYNTSGVQLGSVNKSGSVINDVCFVDETKFIALLDNDSIYVFNYSNPANIYRITSFLTLNQCTTIAYNYLFTSPQFQGGCLYVLDATNNTCSTYMFVDDTTFDNEVQQSFQSSNSYTTIQFNDNTNEILAFFEDDNNVVSVDVYIPDLAIPGKLTLFTTQALSSVGNAFTPRTFYALDYLHSGALTWTQVSSYPVIAISVSRVNPNNVYAVGTDNHIYEGTLAANNTSITDLTQLPYTASYSDISSYKKNNTIAANDQVIVFDNSIKVESSFSLPTANLAAISTNKDQNIVCCFFEKNSALIYSLTGQNSGSYKLPYPSAGFGYSPKELVDSGPYTMTSYQDYLNQMNSAFQSAYTAIKSKYSAYAPTEAPRVVYNPESKLFSLVCKGDYLTAATYRILMNVGLWTMLLFPSSSNPGKVPSDTYGAFKNILVQNNLSNVVFGSSTTIPSFVSVIQESSTIFKFYDLVRILVTTSKIPVNGDVEGVNSTVNLITDIVPDTSTLTPDDIIIYQPTVLRNYNLDSNVPLQNLDVQFYYGCKDGSVYKVQLLPNEYCSCKLEFEQVIF